MLPDPPITSYHSAQIIIDGQRLTPNATGVGRYLSVLLDQWAENPSSLPFQPTIVLRTPRPPEMDPWKMHFRHICRGSTLPGLIWENAVISAPEFRRLPLFAPAKIVPYRWQGPVVLVIHDTLCEHPDSEISRLNRLRFRARYRRSAQRADLILTPSNASAIDIQTHFKIPERRILVIPPGLPAIFHQKNASHFNSHSWIPGLPENYLLFVGKKSARRQFPRILEAIRRIRQSGHSLKLVAVGPISNHHNHDDGLIDLGYVSDQALVDLYQNAMALVWPSSREGFGLPIAESMACGCPVITSPVNAIAEVAGEAAMALSEITPESISSALLQLINNPDLQIQLRQKGLLQASRFNRSVFATKVAQAIATIAN